MDNQWKNKLSPEQYRICGLGGTEPPFSGKYNKHYEKGVYLCAACGQELFSSSAKYDSGSGWPSFTEVIQSGHVRAIEDHSYGMIRTEVRCSRCDSHLGHVFNDGPGQTGERWCINSLALEFKAV